MEPEEASLIFVILLGVISGFFLYFVDISYQVSPEYISGILTASSIFFGLWGFVISRTEDEVAKRLWRLGMRKILSILLSVFAFSVFIVFLSGLGIMPTVITLYVCIWGLLMNAMAMSFALCLRES